MNSDKLVEDKRKWYETDSAMLHVLAMFLMLLDHTWATLLPSQEWMTCVGRIAFPIFAFMIVEGYYYTHNFKKYLLRLLVFALISEMPFNYMCNGTLVYPFHQNVMWTFLIALLGIRGMEQVKKKGKVWFTICGCFLVVGGCTLLGFATFVDYFGVGVLMVFAFYFFRGRKWWCYVGQFATMYWLNVGLLGGYYYPVKIFGMAFELIQQGFALLALIPIWLYRGRQGYHAKWFQYVCYAFYPAHILILVLIGIVTHGL
ncbi:MAG: TraX family protein [Eubacteriales bacterium]|nr:TraX family protein [Eubacteriales bacterium]